ncbi:MAG: hypothetical protein R3D63_10665 [Paracoccaceae bacterium]
MRAPDGTCWIGPAHPFDLAEAYLNYRADLSLAAVPQDATIHISADSRYRLWINGEFLARGPERSWPSSMAVDSHPIARHLQPGVNRIAVQVYSPGYSHFSYLHRAATGLIAWISGDDRTLLATTPDWHCNRDASWHPVTQRVSIYGTGVELRDMAADAPWQTAAPAGAQARIVQPPEGHIWASLRPRATALPVEDTQPLDTPWQTRLGPTPAPCDDPHEDLRNALATFPETPLPRALAAGQTAIWIFDLGHSQSCIGTVRLTARQGSRLTVSYAEKLRDGALLLPDPTTYCRMRPTDRFMLREGPQQAECFTPRGARYLVFRLDATGPTDLPDFAVRLPRSPVTERPLPDLGDPGLNAIAQACRRTTLACLQDGFVDSIWRESSLWLGDAVAQSFALRALTDDPRPHLFALDMAAEGAATDGVLPSVLPGDVPAYVVTDYNFSWVELLWATQGHPGIPDATPHLRRHWATLCRLLSRFEADRGRDGLIRSQPGRRLFLDWSAQGRAEPNLTYNLRHLHALDLAVRMAATLREPSPWAATAATLRQTLRQTHRTADGWLESPAARPPANWPPRFCR